MTYKESFLRFMVDCGVLTFGEFTLKSGRKAPYFINAGNYHSGAQLMELGRYYAACIAEHNIPVETVFGPAYKGIPLAAAAAVALADKYQKDVNFCFDRKEVKDHGEGGMFVGKKLTDGEKVVIIEDVMTSGKAMAEVYPKLKGAADVDITGMVITVDGWSVRWRAKSPLCSPSMKSTAFRYIPSSTWKISSRASGMRSSRARNTWTQCWLIGNSTA